MFLSIQAQREQSIESLPCFNPSTQQQGGGREIGTEHWIKTSGRLVRLRKWDNYLIQADCKSSLLYAHGFETLESKKIVYSPMLPRHLQVRLSYF